MVTNVNQRSISGKKYSDSCSCSVLWVDKSCHIFCGDLFVNKYYFSADSFIDKSILLGFFGKETLKCTVALTAYKDWTVRHQDVRQAKVKARKITDTYIALPPHKQFPTTDNYSHFQSGVTISCGSYPGSCTIQ